MSKIRLRTKLISAFLAVGIIPLTVLGIISWMNSTNALSEQAFKKLETIQNVKKARLTDFFSECERNIEIPLEAVVTLRQAATEKLKTVQEIKKAQIEDYFRKCLSDIRVISKNTTIVNALDRFNAAFYEDGSFNEELYNFLDEEEYGKSLRQFKEEYGYYDLMLITKNGNVVYTLNRESDLGQSLTDESLKETGIGKCFQGALKEVTIYDFTPYTSSDNQHILFLAAPIIQYEETVGVIALKLNKGDINTIVQRRRGMGKTAETYLVGRQEGKVMYRSDRIVGQGKIGDAISGNEIEKALSGESDSVVKIGTKGELEITVYDPLTIPGLNWAIISAMSLEEAVSLKTEGEEEDYFSKFIRKYGYYDLFLIHPDGNIFYTVIHEPDYGTNIINGKYADSNLSRLFQKVLETKTFGFADYEPYEPSGGEPASFIARPLMNGEDIDLIVALQLPTDMINSVMQENSGMGESYLVGRDKIMRSDSHSDPDHYSVRACFADEKKRIETKAVQEALDGKSGRDILINYISRKVLSVYTPLKVWDIEWALISEINESEAFASVRSLETSITMIMIISICTISGIALLFTGYIIRPIRQIINDLIESSYQVASSADQIATNSQAQSENAAHQAASLEESSASLEEIGQMSRENSELTRGARELMNENIGKSGHSLKALVELTREMSQIEADSDQMGQIIKTIDEIAFQTNLLALNAAIEAARAGEAGTGFAVVADEVRNLARRSTDAAKNTQELLDATVIRVSQAADAIKRINNDFEGIIESATVMGEKTAAINKASGEQTRGISQISVAANNIEQFSREIAAASQESASTAEELSAQAVMMKKIVNDLAALVGESADSTDSVDSRGK